MASYDDYLTDPTAVPTGRAKYGFGDYFLPAWTQEPLPSAETVPALPPVPVGRRPYRDAGGNMVTPDIPPPVAPDATSNDPTMPDRAYSAPASPVLRSEGPLNQPYMAPAEPQQGPLNQPYETSQPKLFNSKGGAGYSSAVGAEAELPDREPHKAPSPDSWRKLQEDDPTLGMALKQASGDLGVSYVTAAHLLNTIHDGNIDPNYRGPGGKTGYFGLTQDEANQLAPQGQLDVKDPVLNIYGGLAKLKMFTALLGPKNAIAAMYAGPQVVEQMLHNPDRQQEIERTMAPGLWDFMDKFAGRNVPDRLEPGSGSSMPPGGDAGYGGGDDGGETVEERARRIAANPMAAPPPTHRMLDPRSVASTPVRSLLGLEPMPSPQAPRSRAATELIQEDPARGVPTVVPAPEELRAPPVIGPAPGRYDQPGADAAIAAHAAEPAGPGYYSRGQPASSLPDRSDLPPIAQAIGIGLPQRGGAADVHEENAPVAVPPVEPAKVPGVPVPPVDPNPPSVPPAASPPRIVPAPGAQPPPSDTPPAPYMPAAPAPAAPAPAAPAPAAPAPAATAAAPPKGGRKAALPTPTTEEPSEADRLNRQELQRIRAGQPPAEPRPGAPSVAELDRARTPGGTTPPPASGRTEPLPPASPSGAPQVGATTSSEPGALQPPGAPAAPAPTRSLSPQTPSYTTVQGAVAASAKGPNGVLQYVAQTMPSGMSVGQGWDHLEAKVDQYIAMTGFDSSKAKTARDWLNHVKYGGMMDHLQAGHNYMLANRPDLAAREFAISKLFVTEGSEVQFGVYSDGSIMAQRVNEKTLEPMGKPTPVTEAGVRAQLTRFADVKDFLTAVHQERQLNETITHDQETTQLDREKLESGRQVAEFQARNRSAEAQALQAAANERHADSIDNARYLKALDKSAAFDLAEQKRQAAGQNTQTARVAAVDKEITDIFDPVAGQKFTNNDNSPWTPEQRIWASQLYKALRLTPGSEANSAKATELMIGTVGRNAVTDREGKPLPDGPKYRLVKVEDPQRPGNIDVVVIDKFNQPYAYLPPASLKGAGIPMVDEILAQPGAGRATPAAPRTAVPAPPPPFRGTMAPPALPTLPPLVVPPRPRPELRG